jgi:hypothetical protein
MSSDSDVGKMKSRSGATCHHVAHAEEDASKRVVAYGREVIAVASVTTKQMNVNMKVDTYSLPDARIPCLEHCRASATCFPRHRMASPT